MTSFAFMHLTVVPWIKPMTREPPSRCPTDWTADLTSFFFIFRTAIYWTVVKAVDRDEIQLCIVGGRCLSITCGPAVGVCVPKFWAMRFLTTYWSGRSSHHHTGWRREEYVLALPNLSYCVDASEKHLIIKPFNTFNTSGHIKRSVKVYTRQTSTFKSFIFKEKMLNIWFVWSFIAVSELIFFSPCEKPAPHSSEKARLKILI